MLARRATLVRAAVALWIACRTIQAGEVAYINVPMMGFLRWDVGILFLSVFGLFGEVAKRCLPTWILCALVTLLVLVPQYQFTRIYVQPPAPGHVGSLSSHHGALEEGVCDEIARFAWKSRALWTKFSLSFCLGYFGLGSSANFDMDGDAAEVEYWSFRYGFRRWLAQESDFVLSERGAVHRKMVRKTLAGAAHIFTEPLRKVLASSLNVSTSNVVLGGERGIEDMGHPMIQIWLPNVAWNVVANVHHDLLYAGLDSVGGNKCNEVLTFLLPISVPRGSGLLWWVPDPSRRQLLEHEVLYEKGTLYTFPSGVAHAIRPWPYVEWAATTLRMNIQAFGAQCGGKWYVYH